LISRIDKGLRQRVTVYDFAEIKGSCDDARSIAGVCATVACLTEALGRVARYLSLLCAAADLPLIGCKATDESVGVFTESSTGDRLKSTQKVDRGVGDLGSGVAGVLGKQMAGLCTCGWKVHPTQLNWGSV
jgi:hypothetical protein